MTAKQFAAELEQVVKARKTLMEKAELFHATLSETLVKDYFFISGVYLQLFLRFAQLKGLKISEWSKNELEFPRALFFVYKEIEFYCYANKEEYRNFKEGLLPVEPDVEMFTIQLEEALEDRKKLAKKQELIFCECVDAEADVICHDMRLLEYFAKLHNLKLYGHESEREVPHCYVIYKDIRVVTYMSQEEYKHWLRISKESPAPEAMNKRIEAYANKLACQKK